MKLLPALALMAPVIAAAQGAGPAAGDGQRRIPTELRLNLERVELPAAESLGLLGASYLFEAAPGWWVGPALYGAVSGRRGGLFVFGVEGAWRRAIAGPLELQLGLYAGGGGGGSAPVGGGLMWRPHADLLWNFGGWRAGLTASQVRFSNGDIGSRQLGLVASFDADFAHLPLDGGAAVPARIASRSGLGFDRVLAVAGAYRPRSGTLGVSGRPLKSTLGTVGARAEQRVDGAPWTWGVEAAGAGSGGVAGYAEFLASFGAETAVSQGLTLGARAALGMGGGGDVPTGGGLLLKAALLGNLRLSRATSLTAEAGWARAPQGEFSAPFAALSLNWDLDARGGAAGAAGPTRHEGVVGMQTYRDAARRAGPPRHLQAVVFKFNRFLGDSVYLSGQAHSAWGGGAGGYSVGLIGAGWQWRSEAVPWQLGAELLAGVAGGGGVDSGSGAVVQPMLHAGWRIAPAITARVGAGRVRATQGALSSTVVDVGLAFTFGAGHRH